MIGVESALMTERLKKGYKNKNSQKIRIMINIAKKKGKNRIKQPK